MKLESQRIAIAEYCGKGHRCVLMKRGLYYRHNANGYTDRIHEAWIVSEEEANRHVYPYDEPVTKHPAPTPDYLNDLNAMKQAEDYMEANDPRLCHDYVVQVKAVINRRAGLRPDGMVGDYRLLNADASVRSEAFVQVIGKWE